MDIHVAKQQSFQKDEDVDMIIHHLFSETSHSISLEQIAILSPAARSKLKSRLTKSHVSPRKKKSRDHVLLGESDPLDGKDKINTIPKGRNAPRTMGSVNGQSCEIILDGGSTSTIISYHFALKLGIDKVTKTDATIMFGHGLQYQAIGRVPNLKVQIGNSKVIITDALCYDVNDKYGFLVGRIGLHQFSVHTDWSRHEWSIFMDNGNFIPLDVYYSSRRSVNVVDLNNISDDELDYSSEEEGFLIIEDYDEKQSNYPNLKYITPSNKTFEDPEGRLGNLVNTIRAQDNISANTKNRLIELIVNTRIVSE